jgi:cytochrome P450 enzyme
MTDATQQAPVSLFLDLSFMDDPYPALAKLRADDPVHFVAPLGFWVILRHDDVKRLFNDPENATPDRRHWEHFQPRPEGSFMRWVEDNGFFSLPPAEHARLRKLFSVALTPRAVKRYEAQVRETVERFAAPLRQAEGVIDLMETFANPIPNAVISRITGIPPAGDDERRFRELAQTTIRGFFSFSDEVMKKAGDDAFLEISSWVRELAKARRDSLGEDIISDLIRAQDGGDRLIDDQIVMTITGLIGAGSETTAIGGMIAAMTLLDHPNQMEKLRREPEWIPNAVSEILRFAFGGPAGLPRYAVRDFELRGKTIRKGQMILLSFGSASRDPAVYEDPDRFDVTRDVRDLITFGNGPHYCLGANLARQEMVCMIEAMLDFLSPSSRWRKDLAEFQTIGPFRRPVTLPVELGPRTVSTHRGRDR